ncbi:Pancreatic triacylglycerol lipase [Folsomia candida]|uniref:Pancreatic triacylglycerol lipase n=1 Tax=Folsomia candida TaxID=158441 RepID=A0A226DH83_FOLCA|nr:Pancreatic triacylglycerol lipase [Folsomia candida]
MAKFHLYLASTLFLACMAIAQTTLAPELLPSTDVNLIRFVYYPTTNNPFEIVYNDSDSLEASNLIPNVFQMLAFLSKPGTKNVIIVDWGALSGGDTGLLDLSALLATTMYPIVLLNVPPVGKRVAEFIQFLSLKKGISQSQVWIIGHSLGSHIGGCAGSSSKTLYNQTINRITGLDPAGPLYYLSLSDSDMIYKTNAGWVDIYHTGRGGLGDSRTNSGNIDVFVNGGSSQPGCANLSPSDPLRTCDHYYSWKYFNDTMTSTNLVGCPCLPTLLFPTCFCQNNCSAIGTCPNAAPMGYNAVYGTNGYLFSIDTNTYQ